MDQNFCQSCHMPMGETKEMYGTNSDGTFSDDYCKYCYQDGAFSKEETMEEMIETCIPFVLEAHPGTTADEARKQMLQSFPTLKRWKQG